MAYNDLTSVKKVNGIPVDLRYFDQLNQNDSFFKSVSDADEDLSELDRDILPTTDDMFEIGSNDKAFHRINVHNIRTGYVNILSGNINIPALQIGLAGLASLNNNELSFIGTSGLESLRFMTSGLLIKAANNSQLKIQNTLPGSESLWLLGCDENGFKVGESLLVKDVSTNILNLLKIQSGSIAAPSLTFTGDATTGISKHITNPILNFSLSGVNKLALSSAALEVLSSQLVLPLNSAGTPSLSFAGYLGTGLSSVDGSALDLVLNNKVAYSFKETGLDSRLETGSDFEFTIASATESHRFGFSKAKGTLTIPTAILDEETIFEGSFKGHDGTDYVSGAEIIVQSEEDYGATFGTSIYLRSCSVGESSVEDRLAIGQKEKADVHVSSGLGIQTLKLNSAGTNIVPDVKHVSKIMIDATSGTIELAGFVGGQEGQMLYIFKGTTNNTFRLLFNGASATQKVLLKDSTDFTITNNYGGITLSFDDGVWREISRS